MRVLVTGATGFLGRHVTTRLLERGHDVRVLVRPGRDLSAFEWAGAVEVERADLTASGGDSAAFDGIEALIHLAGVVAGDDEARFETNVEGTRRLLEAMTSTRTRRLVLASSLSVYDWRAVRHRLTERTPIADVTTSHLDSYTVSKVMQEQVAHEYAARNGWHLSVLRPGAIWGADRLHLPELGLGVGFVHVTIAPCSVLRSTYVENCADAFVRVIEAPRAALGALNVVDEPSVTCWRFLRSIRRVTHDRRLPIPVPYVAGRALSVVASWAHRAVLRRRGRLPGLLSARAYQARFKPAACSADELRRATGWRPTFGFDDGLARAALRLKTAAGDE